VSASVFDDIGNENIKNLLQSVTDTDFKKENLEALLRNETTVEDWRVGEALAEQYLSDSKNCHFPWPDGRDERKRGSSLPGADLVGFQDENEKARFAFGEVKTSAERKYPPGVMHGRHGLKQQLEDLRDCKKIRDALVKYLGHRAAGSSWCGRYKNAAKHYLQNSTDVRVFGILVRDVTPHTDDLHARAEKLAVDCPVAMRIELIAIYLPPGSISTLSATVIASRRHAKGGKS
jgi:hypothetical protein